MTVILSVPRISFAAFAAFTVPERIEEMCTETTSCPFSMIGLYASTKSLVDGCERENSSPSFNLS